MAGPPSGKEEGSPSHNLPVAAQQGTAPSPNVSDSSLEAGSEPFGLALPGFVASGGELLLVCGRVGSGKTSLCSALLGLLSPSQGTSVRVRGRVAYVPQTAFVMNATVKENILFGDDASDPKLYEAVVRACALEADIAALPAGDQTEVGERGITISGGQKQRVAIARAAFAKADFAEPAFAGRGGVAAAAFA